MDTLNDFMNLMGLGRAEPEERRRLLLWLAGIACWALFVAYNIHEPGWAAVLGVGISSAVVLRLWLKLERRPLWRRILALGLALLPGALTATAFFAWTGLARPELRFGLELKIALAVAAAPVLMIAGFHLLLDMAQGLDPIKCLVGGGLLGAAIGGGGGLAVVGEPEAALAFGLVFAFKLGAIGLRLACVSQAMELERLTIEEERLARDPIRRHGLTPQAVHRVYRVLARFAHADGKVDTDERALLESLRERFELSPAEGDRLELEGQAESRIRLGRGRAERNLLWDSLAKIVQHRESLQPGEKEIYRAALAGMRAASAEAGRSAS